MKISELNFQLKYLEKGHKMNENTQWKKIIKIKAEFGGVKTVNSKLKCSILKKIQ